MKLALSMYLCFVLMGFISKGQSQTPNDERKLHIKGAAILKQVPEIISVAINIKIESKEYRDCQDSLMIKLKQAKELFINKGIEKDLIKTTDIRVSESKVYQNGKEVKVGFVGNVSFVIETVYSVDFTKKILLGLSTGSMPFNYNISFKLSETQKELLRNNAISKAIDDAKEKAVLIAESSNVKLERINSIVYNDNTYFSGANDNDIIKEYRWNPENSAFASYGVQGMGNNIPTIDFNPKEIKIVKTVEIEWLIKE